MIEKISDPLHSYSSCRSRRSLPSSTVKGGPIMDAPVVLLLHGFPTSSFQYRELIPRLADRYRVIAPDLPGFGFTEVPEKRHYEYNFDALAGTILAFTDALHLERYALYVFDYGAPTGFRLAMARPKRVTAIVSQNGNAYEEGLGAAWAPIRRYWSEPTSENREAIRMVLNLEGMRREYSSGIPNPDLIALERLHAGCRTLGAARQRGHSAGSVPRLCQQCDTLSGFSGIFPESKAAAAGDMG